MKRFLLVGYLPENVGLLDCARAPAKTHASRRSTPRASMMEPRNKLTNPTPLTHQTFPTPNQTPLREFGELLVIQFAAACLRAKSEARKSGAENAWSGRRSSRAGCLGWASTRIESRKSCAKPRTRARTHTHTHTQPHTYINTHTHSHIHIYINTHTHTTHIHIYKHTHTHTQSHTHTDTQ